MVSKKTKPMMNKKNDLKKAQKQKNGTNCKENVCEQIMKLLLHHIVPQFEYEST